MTFSVSSMVRSSRDAVSSWNSARVTVTTARPPLWVIIAKPDLAKNYGKAYALDATRFTGSDKRSQAFEAGALDLAASSANGVTFGNGKLRGDTITFSIDEGGARREFTGRVIGDRIEGSVAGASVGNRRAISVHTRMRDRNASSVLAEMLAA